MAEIQSKVEALQAQLPLLQIVTAESPAYASSIKRWNHLSQKNAGIVAYPTSSHDVTTLVKFSQAQGLDLAVRCGGHSMRPASSTEGGLCIDLSKMREVTVDTPAKQVVVQGGALLGNVYDALAPHNLAIVAGVIRSVGVGGLSLLGGYGWLTGAHGLTLDNIVSVELILASGDIVQASENKNTDFFWAMRGAGPCFGVVTSFTYQAYPQENLVWNGNVILPGTALQFALEAANKVLAKENDSGKASLTMLWVSPPGASAPAILMMLYYNGPEDEAKSFFKDLLVLNPRVNTTKMRPWHECNVEEPSADASQIWRKAGSDASIIGPYKLSFFESLWADYVKLLKEVDDAKTTSLGLVVHNPYTMMRKGQTDTAFPNRGRHSNWMIAPNWTREENDKVCTDWCLEMREKCRRDRERKIKDYADLDEMTKSATGEYSSDDKFGRSAREIFGVNYERLVTLKAKYDPQNVFNKFADLTGK